MERYLAISCDSHCGPQPHVIREYLDSQYREQYDETLAAEAEAIKQGITQSVTIGGSKMDTWGATPRAVYFQHERLKSGGEAALWDPARRAEEMEKDGTAAEMIFAGPGDDNTGAVGTPFTARRTPRGMTPTPEYKLRFAGANAYNRWLADMCSYDIDRHAGVIVCPLDDLTGAIEEIRRARKSGLYGGYSFPQPTVPVTNTEAFWLHPRFEPLWDTLEELDIPIQSHQSSGGINYGNYDGTRWIVSLEGHFVARRPLWQLIFSGVFERHPNLKLCLTEVGGVDIPYWLNTFDYFYEGKRGKELRQILPMKPSEYWRRQCFLGLSPFGGRPEIEFRDKIGIGNIMWGSDYPHKEGAWPYTRERMLLMFAGLPQEEVRAILSQNPARAVSFNVKKLRAIADKIGPEVDEFPKVAPEGGQGWGKLWTEPLAAL